MSFDITPLVPKGRQIIESYGDTQFRIAGKIHEGSILVFSERCLPWPVTDPGDVSAENLVHVLRAEETVKILILGCGPVFAPEPKGLRRALKDHGTVLEWMDTGAACRTFNVLLTEERPVAAALIAVP